MADIESLIADLRAEQESVDGVLAQIDAAAWQTDTPAEGWKVADQVAHLTYFDGAVTLAVTDADAFSESQLNRKADADYVNTVAKDLVALPAEELWQKWKDGRDAMYQGFRDADPTKRYPWYGPPMSIASACTARIMETWAHGQDICDGVGIQRAPSDRLKHVLFIGYKARPFAYANRGLDLPAGDVRLELTGPDGGTWTFGDSDTDVIRGSALDMALLVTQRRHRADTSLTAEGPLADDFLDKAQAFAGPPGGGRRPGQFPKS
ncbi:TIGR03084 family metal-binding protein [Cumulibacter soli]|uniref:TIGR03084 family metal-binding protein n=1 Tax=Cumulibacter soli TaxID=2546344 RepID=UPI0010682747|nr:TIGR03084 family metal-binding protein [Cumulibacter soli]